MKLSAKDSHTNRLLDNELKLTLLSSTVPSGRRARQQPVTYPMLFAWVDECWEICSSKDSNRAFTALFGVCASINLPWDFYSSRAATCQ